MAQQMAALRTAGRTNAEIAAQFNVHRTYVSRLVNTVAKEPDVRTSVALPRELFHALMQLPECKTLTAEEAIAYAVNTLVEESEP